MKHATGHYLNVFGQGYDIFVIFNEANDVPTTDDFAKIGEVVEQAITSGIPDEDALGSFRNKLERLIEDTELPCVQCGVQVIFAL